MIQTLHLEVDIAITGFNLSNLSSSLTCDLVNLLLLLHRFNVRVSALARVGRFPKMPQMWHSELWSNV